MENSRKLSHNCHQILLLNNSSGIVAYSFILEIAQLFRSALTVQNVLEKMLRSNFSAFKCSVKKRIKRSQKNNDSVLNIEAGKIMLEKEFQKNKFNIQHVLFSFFYLFFLFVF